VGGGPGISSLPSPHTPLPTRVNREAGTGGPGFP